MMLDYRAQLFVLEQVQQTLADLASAPEFAELGALIDHLFTHAAADGQEMNLLEQASSVWQHGVGLFDDLTQVRADLEGALDNPADPASADRFNNAAVKA